MITIKNITRLQLQLKNAFIFDNIASIFLI